MAMFSTESIRRLPEPLLSSGSASLSAMKVKPKVRIYEARTVSSRSSASRNFSAVLRARATALDKFDSRLHHSTAKSGIISGGC